VSRGPPEWQPRQLSVWLATGVPPSWVKAMIAPLAVGLAACTEPGPWQASQVAVAGLAATATCMPSACAVCAKLSLSLAWQAVQTCSPTGLASGGAVLRAGTASAKPGGALKPCPETEEAKRVSGSLTACAGAPAWTGASHAAETSNAAASSNTDAR